MSTDFEDFAANAPLVYKRADYAEYIEREVLVMIVGNSTAPLALTFIIGGLIAIVICAAIYLWGRTSKKLDEKQRIGVLKTGVYSFMALAFGIWLVWIGM